MIDYQEIDEYLSGAMKGEDVLRFEEKMQNDIDLAIEVELYQAIQLEGSLVQTQAAEKAQLKDTLQQLNQRHFSPTPVIDLPSQTASTVTPEKTRPIRKLIMWVASVAAILMVVLLVKNSGSISNDNQQLFTQYATADDLNSERGDENNALQLQADSLFNNKNYAAAIPVINNFLENDPNADAATDYHLALGYSYIQTDDYKKADEILSEIANGSSLYANRAKWYIALMLLKQNNTGACIKQIKTLPETATDYKKAMELLDTLQ